MIQIALTLWIAILNLQLQASQIPNLSPEVQTQVKMVSDLGLGYVHQILNNPVAETKPIVEEPKTTEVVTAPVVIPLEFTVLPTITATTTVNGLVRSFHFETNIPATATFYVGQSPRDIGYSTTTSTSFNFDYAFLFDYYKIEIKAGGQTKTYQDRCDGSPTCFNPARTGPREYTIN